MVEEFGTAPEASSEAVAPESGAPRRRRAARRPAGPPPAHVEQAPTQLDEGGQGVEEVARADEAAAEQVEKALDEDQGVEEASQADADAEVEPDAVADAEAQADAEAEAEPDADQSHDEGTSTEPAAPAAGGGDAADEPATAGRRPRRATRGVTTVAFSGGAAPEPEVAPAPPVEPPPLALFQPPDEARAVRRRRSRATAAEVVEPADQAQSADQSIEAGERADESEPPVAESAQDTEGAPAHDDEGAHHAEAEVAHDAEHDDDAESPRRRRRRGGRRRRRGGQGGAEPGEGAEEGAEAGSEPDEQGTEGAQAEEHGDSDRAGETGEDQPESSGGDEEGGGSRRRRRRRRRAGVAEEMEDLSTEDQASTVVKVREGRRTTSDEITSVRGSTRIEAKRQRRRDGREAGRRRAPILTEAEFLARRESVNRVMCVREHGDRTQIAVLEDGILVEHYVNRAESSSMVGNVYLGKVQNVLPSMEAAFVDIGRGRNAVLYAGEVNWDAAGLEGQPKRIELALKSGDPVLVQVTKDPIGHKGARLTSQISLPGRFLVYVPEGSMTGISRKLPDTERSRLKGILKDVVPEGAGVIVRTAAEGATEDQLTADVTRLTAQWNDITKKAKSASPPTLLYGEPDLAIKVVRDIFNEDFTTLLVQGEDTWQTLTDYIGWVAPDLSPKLQRWSEPTDLYAAHRIDEQLAKALDRKVWLPSGGSLVIDRTEAMTVVDVNTGKFTGQGGNLEETVTKNNLEAAEEIVRQLRLRDIGGIVVIDFIDMVLESNRDLVLRRLVECLGRDRTKHQVAEVTSLGLVQMTRKRIGQGLLEVFSTPCEACGGRGHVVHTEPVGAGSAVEEPAGRRDRDRGRRAKAPLPVNLGGKQTGKTPPPPKFDEHGHIDHTQDPHAELEEHPGQEQPARPAVEIEGDVDPVERDLDPVVEDEGGAGESTVEAAGAEPEAELPFGEDVATGEPDQSGAGAGAEAAGDEPDVQPEGESHEQPEGEPEDHGPAGEAV